MSDSPGLVDLTIGLVNSLFNLNFLSKDQLTKKKDPIQIKDLISNK